VQSFDVGISIAFEREGVVDRGQFGSSLRIFLVEGEGEKRKTVVREVTWVFERELVKWGPVVWVGICLANPTREGEGGVGRGEG